MSARKRPTPKPKPKAKGPKTLQASGRTVAVRVSRDRVVITIDGNEIPGVRKLADGQYHSEFLPFRGYASAEEIGRALAGHAGSTFTLGAGSGGHQHPGGGGHAGSPKKRSTRGRS